MNPASRWLNIDTRILYVILVISVLFPLIKPLGLPLTITDGTRDAYDFMESLPKGSIVLYAIDVAPSNEAENWPQALAMVKHSVRKGHRLVMTTFIPEGVMYAERIAKQVAEPAGYVYGKDFVILPYRAGQETAVAALGEDIRGLYKTDYYGKDLSTLPIMQDVKSIKDIALCNLYSSGDLGMWFARQVEAKFKTPTIMGTVAIGITIYGPFYSSKQFRGLLLGQAGAAEYELLIKQPGKGVAAMDAQSLGHLYMIALIILSNVLYFMVRKQAARSNPGPEGGSAHV